MPFRRCAPKEVESSDGEIRTPKSILKTPNNTPNSASHPDPEMVASSSSSSEYEDSSDAWSGAQSDRDDSDTHEKGESIRNADQNDNVPCEKLMGNDLVKKNSRRNMQRSTSARVKNINGDSDGKTAGFYEIADGKPLGRKGRPKRCYKATAAFPQRRWAQMKGEHDDEVFHNDTSVSRQAPIYTQNSDSDAEEAADIHTVELNDGRKILAEFEVFGSPFKTGLIGSFAYDLISHENYRRYSLRIEMTKIQERRSIFGEVALLRQSLSLRNSYLFGGPIVSSGFIDPSGANSFVYYMQPLWDGPSLQQIFAALLSSTSRPSAATLRFIYRQLVEVAHGLSECGFILRDMQFDFFAFNALTLRFYLRNKSTVASIVISKRFAGGPWIGNSLYAPLNFHEKAAAHRVSIADMMESMWYMIGRLALGRAELPWVNLTEDFVVENCKKWNIGEGCLIKRESDANTPKKRLIDNLCPSFFKIMHYIRSKCSLSMSLGPRRRSSLDLERESFSFQHLSELVSRIPNNGRVDFLEMSGSAASQHNANLTRVALQSLRNSLRADADMVLLAEIGSRRHIKTVQTESTRKRSELAARDFEDRLEELSIEARNYVGPFRRADADTEVVTVGPYNNRRRGKRGVSRLFVATAVTAEQCAVKTECEDFKDDAD